MVVMDLSRLVVAYCANALAALGNREKIFDCLFNASDWSSVVSRGSPMLKPQETNVLLLLRTITNYFQDGILLNDGRWIQQVREVPISFNSLTIPRSRSLRHLLRHRTISSRNHNGWRWHRCYLSQSSSHGNERRD